MTNNEIDKIAKRIASIVVQALEDKQLEWDRDLITELQEFQPPSKDKEQILLAELAKCMTLLDSYLKAENYEQCSRLKRKITEIETKLNQL